MWTRLQKISCEYIPMHDCVYISEPDVVKVIDGLDALDEPVGRRAQLQREQRRVRQPREARQRAARRRAARRELKLRFQHVAVETGNE